MIEAVSGRFIGLKTWDRSVRIFGARLDNPQQCMDSLGCLCCDLCIKSCFGVYETKNGHGIRFHNVEPRSVEWVAHGQPTILFLGLLKTVLVGLNWTKNVHVWCV